VKLCTTCNQEVTNFASHEDILKIIYTLSKRSYAILIRSIIEEKSLHEISKHHSVTQDRIRCLKDKAVKEIIKKCSMTGININFDQIISILKANQDKLIGVKAIQKYTLDPLFWEENFKMPYDFDLVINPNFLPKQIENEITIEEQPIEMLMMSIRSTNCLKYFGITTIGELIETPASSLFSIKNLGIKCLKEISDSLLKLNITPHFDWKQRNATKDNS